MRLEPVEPPRRFRAGEVTVSHCADVTLDPDEQITLRGPSGSELDVVRKSWGYYAASSLNGRLPAHGLHARLVVSRRDGRLFLLLVEDGAEDEFAAYIEREGMAVVWSLDSDEEAAEAVRRLAGD